jgi:hypothetical protein
MSDDLVQQLRDLAPLLGRHSTDSRLIVEAADRIETLERVLKEIDRILLEALTLGCDPVLVERARELAGGTIEVNP